MSYYDADPILDAVVALLQSALPAKVNGKTLVVDKDAEKVLSGMVIVELAVAPIPTSIHMGGHDWAVAGIQVTDAMPTRDQARKLGSLIRTALVAQTPRGQLATPVLIPGHKVLDVSSLSDGFADSSSATTGVVYQWAETYKIRFT